MTRPHLCIHGHFYQPPRENPWTGLVDEQPSAAPAHDWNDRITNECYLPNTAALVRGVDGQPDREFSNYEHMSFDFGPTLLTWLARERPAVHDAIVAADRASRPRFSGHGAAIAQSYSHAILPLASQRDRRTEIRWGLRDFELRFGRSSEGLWLPECAVDTTTLEALVDEGLRFVLLAPQQAASVRRLGDPQWTEVGGARDALDTRVAYRVALPSGRSIAAFFYDGHLAHSVAFGEALKDGEAFLAALDARWSGDGDGLVHLATDGETYGHHHAFAELGLAWVLDRVSRGANSFDPTIYAEHLDRRPPEHEARIVERSSWSCAHGIERWRSHCGCSGGRRSGTQAWRRPLRDAFDILRDMLARLFEREGARLLADPWAARDSYVEVLVRPADSMRERFLERHQAHPLSVEEGRRALELLEMQRHGLLLYASCAWFFDDLTDIEPMQALAHAARAVELAGPPHDEAIGLALRGALSQAVGNDGQRGDELLDQVVAERRPASD